MKKTFPILLIVMFVSLPLAAAENHALAGKQSSVSWGGKLGFSSCSTYLTRASINGEKFDEYTQDTHLGNFLSVNMQYGCNNFFFQTGLGLSINTSAFHVDLAEHDKDSEEPETFGLKYSMTSLILPVQVGYSIVMQPPYKMSLYAGPSVRMQFPDRYECSVTDESVYSIDETPRRFLFGGTMGFCVQTGRTFFDVEYELVLSNISEHLHVTKNSTELQDLKLGRRMGIFSFSYGILF